MAHKKRVLKNFGGYLLKFKLFIETSLSHWHRSYSPCELHVYPDSRYDFKSIRTRLVRGIPPGVYGYNFQNNSCEIQNLVETHLCKPCVILPSRLTPLEPQSRLGTKLLEIWLVCPQNGTAVLKGLIRVLCGLVQDISSDVLLTPILWSRTLFDFAIPLSYTWVWERGFRRNSSVQAACGASIARTTGIIWLHEGYTAVVCSPYMTEKDKIWSCRIQGMGESE